MVAITIATVIAWRNSISWRRSPAVFGAALLAGLLGGHALDLVVDWGYYAEDLSRIYNVGLGGFTLFRLGGNSLRARLTTFTTPAWFIQYSTVLYAPQPRAC